MPKTQKAEILPDVYETTNRVRLFGINPRAARASLTWCVRSSSESQRVMLCGCVDKSSKWSGWSSRMLAVCIKRQKLLASRTSKHACNYAASSHDDKTYAMYMTKMHHVKTVRSTCNVRVHYS